MLASADDVLLRGSIAVSSLLQWRSQEFCLEGFNNFS
jgi:hypothetical protein